MAFFDDLTTSLKQKWLQFFHVNRSWIARQMEVEYVDTPDGGRRPSSFLILGVVSALEPQLAQLMLPFTKLNSDINSLIEVLELNFDPNLFGNNSFNPTVNPDDPMDMLLEIPGEVADEVVVLEDSNSVVVINVAETEFGDTSFNPMGNEMAQGLELESLQSPSATEPEVSDGLHDEETQGIKSEPEQIDENYSGKEKTSEDDEISRLFPNF